mgnify:FL=1
MSKKPRTEAQKLARKLRDNTPEGKMNNKIQNWKQNGLVCADRDEYELVYFTWLDNEKCENPKCIEEYTETNWKCMDHEHLDGKKGPFRSVLCNDCNIRTNDRNKSGHNGICKHADGGWQYSIMINKVRHTKYHKDLELLVQYKEEYENEHLYHI